jgi:hypothetical protein
MQHRSCTGNDGISAICEVAVNDVSIATSCIAMLVRRLHNVESRSALQSDKSTTSTHDNATQCRKRGRIMHQLSIMHSAEAHSYRAIKVMLK